MSNPKLWQQYRSLLDKADFVITYAALSDEIPAEETPRFEIIQTKPTFVVPATHKIEPRDVAKEIQNIINTPTLGPRHCCAGAGTPSNTHWVFSGSRRALIFLPGQKFDLQGTRKGRGFGWYDRLLAELPKDWIRIGVATASQIESTPLIRNHWDQPIDWLFAQQESEKWNIHAFSRNRDYNR